MEIFRLLIPATLACCCNAMADMFWKMQFDKKPLSIHSLMDILMREMVQAIK